MRLLIDIVVLILWFLIKIGDFVIIAGGQVVDKIKKIPRLLYSKHKKVRIKVKKPNKSVSLQRQLYFKLPLIKFPVLSFGIPKRKRRIKLKKGSRPVSVFPGPVPNFTKFKYFMLGSTFSFLLIYIPLLFLIFLQNLPNPRLLALRDISQTTKIYDRNGLLLYQLYANQNRTLVSLNSIPKDLINATIAIEDKDFYTNPGFNVGSIIRAAIANLKGEPLQGGSTITQQLIKATLLTPERSLSRKIKEIILAFWSERIFSKDQILTMYFNQVSYGGTSWGVEAASQTYFGKEAKDLDLAQSAFLAGLTKAPTTYYPYGENPMLWKDRQREVLKRMTELGFINKDQRGEAEKEELTFLPPQSPIHAPHFVFYVKDYLIQKYGLPMVEKGGLSVVTSLDLKLQEKAQEVVKTEVDKSFAYNLSNGAALITNPKTGDILAMVGSKDYDEAGWGKVNLTTAPRQPGSSVKVITYSAALQNGLTAASIIPDTPTAFGAPGYPSYVPVNYDGQFHGNVSVRVALANSINIPAVKTLQNIGIPTMVNLARRMGITTWKNPDNYGLALTLGAAEVKMVDMAEVYGTLANLGEKVDLNPILKVSDAQGQTIFEKKNPQKTRVLDSGIAYIIANILSDNGARAMEFGTNSPLNIPGFDVSVKTGTSDKFKDNWTIGFTPNFLVAVWVGNNNGQPMNGIVSGITGAAPIWHTLMSDLVSKSGNQKLQKPDNVISKPCIGRVELFIKGTENSVNCNPLPTPSPDPLKEAGSQQQIP